MADLDPTQVVKGHEKLTEIFGRWPSFHDAEVLGIRLDRRGSDEWEGPVVFVSVHVFEGYREDEHSKEVKWRKHTVVTFRFSRVVDISLLDFNQQNAIWNLTFETGQPEYEASTWVGPAYRVTFQPCFGVSFSFVCGSAEVDSVERTCPEGSVYA